MRYADMKQSIVEQYKLTNKVAFFVKGPPGCAKTALAKEIGALPELKFDRVVFFYASMREPTDLLGTPDNKGEVTRWVPPEELFILREGRNLLVLDEVSDATIQMQNPICSLVHERRVNNTVLSNETFILMTGNRTQDKSGANRIVTKLSNRVRNLTMDVHLDDWMDWALGAGINHKLLSFIKFRPGLLMDFRPDRDENPTPRSWERVSMIPHNLPTGSFFENVKGEVGEGAAAEYTGFLKIAEQIVSPEEVLMNPAGVKLPTEPAAMYALTGAVAHSISKDNFDRLQPFINRLPKEHQVMLISDARKLAPSIVQTKGFVEWCVTNKNVLL